jgi:hypothetical protein
MEQFRKVRHEARASIGLLQLIEIAEISVQELMIPFQQRCLCRWMRFAVFKQRPSGDDVEHDIEITKSLPIENIESTPSIRSMGPSLGSKQVL